MAAEFESKRAERSGQRGRDARDLASPICG